MAGKDSKRVDELIKVARVRNWKIDWTKGSHLRFVPPDPNAEIVIHSGSSGDRRAVKNLIAQLRRSGLKV